MAERRVLVTGATGLIGRNVVSALRESGVEVHAVTRSLTHVTHDGEVRWHKANLLDHRDRTQLLDAAAPQTVIHCAWVTEHGAYWTSPENLDWVGATLSLAREAHDRGTSRFVGVGTCAEYEWGGAAPLSEASTPLRPQTLYGVAKNATRSVLDAFCTARGLEFAWGRVAMLYGAGEHPDRFVAAVARALAKGKPAKMSSGTAVRDFMDARDVGGAIAALAMTKVTGAVNIASGEAISLLDTARTLARLASKPELLTPGALPDRPGDPLSLAVDATRLHRDVGYRPKLTLEQGLSDALAYWRAQVAS